MTLEEFFVLLKTSHLLRPEQFALLRGDIARLGPNITAQQVADRLMHQNLLTPWQSEQLLVHGWNGFRVGNYTLTEQIGKGGMGAVFKAEHSVMGRDVAVKVLSKARLDNPSAVARFRREVKAAAALDHPNIIVAHDAGQVGDVHYLVMEYVEGRDLNAWLMEYGRLPVQWACEFIRQAALGLEHAWQKGMVHRDIKPANLLVLWSDREKPPVVKILDMGLARFTQELVDELDEADRKSKKRFDSTDGHLTQVGQILGTPDYLAPEQIQGTHTVDIRADIFSLGCTLFKLLTGTLPFGGEKVMEKLQARIDFSAPPAPLLSTFRGDIPPRLDEIVARMLERDPRSRYQQPSQVAHDLSLLGFEEHWTREAPIHAAGTVSTSSHEASSIAVEAPAQLLAKPSYQPGAFQADADSGTRAFLSHLARKVTSEYGDSTEEFADSLLPPLVTGGPAPNYEDAQGAPPFAEPVRQANGAMRRPDSPHAARRRQLRKRQSMVAMIVAAVATVVVGIGLMYGVTVALNRFQDRPPVTYSPSPLDTPPGKSSPGRDLMGNPLLLHVLKGHSVGVSSVAVSENYVVTGGMDGLVKVWDRASGKGQKTFLGHDRWVNAAAITPSENFIATGARDTVVRLWSPDGASDRELDGHNATISRIKISSNGSNMLTGDVEGNTLLWVRGRGKPLPAVDGRLLAVGFSAGSGDDRPGGRPVAVVSHEDSLLYWDLAAKRPLLKIDKMGAVRSACLSADGRYLACGTTRGVVYVINTLTQKQFSYIAHSDWVLSLDLSKDGSIIASGSQDHTVFVRHIDDSKGRKYLGHSGPVLAVAISDDGRALVSGSKDETARLWYIPPEPERDP